MKTKTFITFILAIGLVLSLSVSQVSAKENKTEKPFGQNFNCAQGDNIEKVLSKIERHSPEDARKLRELREKDPQAFAAEMEKIATHIKERMGSRDSSKKQRRGKDKMRKFQAEFLEWFELSYPKEFEALSKSDDCEKIHVASKKYMPIFMALKKGRPEVAQILKKDIELALQRDGLIREFNATDDVAAKDSIADELKIVVSQRFEIVIAKKRQRFDQLKSRIAELEKEVEKQEATLEQLEAEKEKQVEQRLKELTQPEITLQWN